MADLNLLLAKSWVPDIDPTGWWMSEKLDGVRAYWNGRELLTRNGNVIHAPDWFLRFLPPYSLDGELWMGRKMFQETVSIVRRKEPDERWLGVYYMVFDAPSAATYEVRLDDVLQSANDRVKPVLTYRCKSVEHLKNQLQAIEMCGGEGIMLRQPESHYEAKRSNTLLKVKTFHDAEAVVVAHEPGMGKHKGRLGALLVEANGHTFGLGTGFTDEQRKNPPAIGDVVTYRYQELTKDGVPRFPVFVRVRSDHGV